MEDDNYTVTETDTAQGYTLLRDSIEIVIATTTFGVVDCRTVGANALTAYATVNGNRVDMLENNSSVNAIVPLTVINTRTPDLPVTGDDGVWMYGVVGILLMAAAAATIVLVIRKKKPSKQ